MSYEAQNYEHLLGTPGFSDNLLNAHFKLYQGYVKNTNVAIEKLEAARGEDKLTPELAELKRRFGWEFNGMRLHELYFGNMSKESVEFDMDSKLAEKIKKDFGSLEAAHKEFIAVGSMRGIGWTILCHDKAGDRLFTTWINEHDLGHLAGATPLLVMDVFEHAFIAGYGMNRADYISAFLKAVDWNEVNRRYE